MEPVAGISSKGDALVVLMTDIVDSTQLNESVGDEEMSFVWESQIESRASWRATEQEEKSVAPRLPNAFSRRLERRVFRRWLSPCPGCLEAPFEVGIHTGPGTFVCACLALQPE